MHDLVDQTAPLDPSLVAQVEGFHGHRCPGSAIGMRVSQLALAAFGRHSKSNPIVAIAETNLCAVDAVQYLTGCTFGKRNLLHLDHGKNVFTFWRQGAAEGIRIVVQPDSPTAVDPEYWAVHERIHAGTASAGEEADFTRTQQARYRAILEMDLQRLCVTMPAPDPAPSRMPAQAPVACAACGELTLGSYLESDGSGQVCRACRASPEGRAGA